MTVIVEPITDRALHILALAAQDAKRRGHRSVRSEHVLLAILGEGGGVACRVLRDLAVDSATLSEDLEKRLQRQPPNGQANTEAAADQVPPGLLPAAVGVTSRLLGRQLSTAPGEHP
jgi:ATP-dependent Clp protease ATP-binding subunit ClpA